MSDGLQRHDLMRELDCQDIALVRSSCALSRQSPPRSNSNAVGKGSPSECRPTNFAYISMPYKTKYGMKLEELSDAHNDGTIKEPELDVFFDHDPVRESGHDTSNRLEGLAADLATIDLNCLLYQMESDIALVIENYMGDTLTVPAELRTPRMK
ncbi:MAG: hypothetical protein Q9170_000712 [Blastenia crenularia]